MKTISKHKIEHSRELTPLELNAIHFNNKRTLITPEDMEKISAQKQGKGADG